MEQARRRACDIKYAHSHHQMVRRLLEQYPNLYVDYSWIVYDVVICPGGHPSDDWLALTERFSDRTCLGSDLVTRFERLGPELQRYDVFLDRLSETARANVCYRTAERIYDGNKGKLKRAEPLRMPAWSEVLAANSER